MTRWIGMVRRAAFGIAPEEASFARRGFRMGAPDVVARLERAGRAFLEGYDAALEGSEPLGLARRLDTVVPEDRGFAFEGGAMALGLLDGLLPGRRDRCRRFDAACETQHTYMIHVGLGWAWARLGTRIDRAVARLDPLLRWLAVDGYGFHHGYFDPMRHLRGQAVPTGLSGYAPRAFDQGLGRSLWFAECGDDAEIAAAIGGFPPPRRPDLWAGVGLAAAYAGGGDHSALSALTMAAGDHAADLAQGAAFAAKARLRAGNPADHTDLACEILCGCPASVAASVTDQALQETSSTGQGELYESWRCRIRERLVEVRGANTTCAATS